MSIEDNVFARRLADEVWEFSVSEGLGLSAERHAAYMQRLYERMRDALPEHLQPKKVVKADLVPMTRDELCKFGMHRMEFGKWQGKMVDEVPLDYLLWLDGQPDFRHELRRYLANPTIQREQEGE